MFGISFAGIAAKLAGNAILGRVGKNAKGDFSALAGWIGRRSALELLGFVAMAIAVWQHFSLVHTRHALATCTSGRAEDAQALKASHANEALLRGQLVDQNVRVNALASKSAAEQQQATEARQRNAQRVTDAKDVSAALAAAARQKPAPAAPSKPCEPSDLLKEQWK